MPPANSADAQISRRENSTRHLVGQARLSHAYKVPAPPLR